MRAPKLTWAEFKDADGNWLPTLNRVEIISLLEVRLSSCIADRYAQADRIAALEAGLVSLIDDLNGGMDRGVVIDRAARLLAGER